MVQSVQIESLQEVTFKDHLRNHYFPSYPVSKRTCHKLLPKYTRTWPQLLTANTGSQRHTYLSPHIDHFNQTASTSPLALST